MNDYPAQAAFEWLIKSNIQKRIGEDELRGGVHRGYDWIRGTYEYLYCEITGYYISTLVHQFQWSGKRDYLERAQLAARFLMRLQCRDCEGKFSGAIPHSWDEQIGHASQNYYSFDNAMCLQGLLDLYQLTGDEELCDRGLSIGQWLLQMQADDGSFLAWFDRKSGELQHPEDVIFGDGGCLHAKHSISLIKLSVLTGRDEYADAARSVCDWVLELQDDDGGIRASRRTDQVVSHTHCYAIEGLLYAYHHFRDEQYLEAAKRAANWLLTAQHADGSIAIAYKRKWRDMGRRIVEVIRPRRVSDATSQAIRIWTLLYQLDGNPAWLRAGERAANFLGRLQAGTQYGRNARGGFYYWQGHPVLYAWPAMFAAHALYRMAQPAEAGHFSELIEELF